MTRLFWAKRDQFEFITSDAARQEITDTPDEARRAQMSALLDALTIHPLTQEMRALARRYVDAGIFPEAVIVDAVHVAAAVLTRNEILVSWNFKHLVNRRRRAAVMATRPPKKRSGLAMRGSAALAATPRQSRHDRQKRL